MGWRVVTFLVAHRGRLTALLLIGSGVVLSIAVFVLFRRVENHRIEADFARRGTARTNMFQKVLETRLATLHALASFHAASDNVRREEFYDRPMNWFEYLNDRVNTGAPQPAEAEQFAEIKATRDVLVHGQGVANAYYVDKAGHAARAQSGQPLDIAEPYHHASWGLIRKLVADIGTGMAAKA